MLSLFIVYEGEFRDIVNVVEQLIGKQLIIAEDEIGQKGSLKMFDIEFLLMGNHDLEDDLGIPFTNYQIQINLIELCSAQRYGSYLQMVKSIAVYLADKIYRMFNTEVIIVEDLQDIICNYNK